MASHVQSGNLTAVTFTALGTNGRTASTYAGTANLTSSDSGATFYASATSTTPVTSVTFANGTATVYVKFAKTGQQTVTSTDSTTSSITGSAGTSVTAPDPVTQYFMVLNPTVVAGSPTTVKIYAEDANGFVVRNYATPSDFTLTSTDGKAVLPGSVSFVNGVATVQVTFETGGTTESLTAADAAGKVSDTVSTSVVTDSASQYEISLPSVVRAGQSVQVQVFAVDAYGHLVRGYTGSATVAITGSSTTSENVTFTNGVATFSVTFASSAVGTQGTVTVTDQATTNPLPTAEAFTAVVSGSGGRGGGWGWTGGWGGGGGGSGGNGSGGSGSGGSGSGGSGGSGSSGWGSGTTDDRGFQRHDQHELVRLRGANQCGSSLGRFRNLDGACRRKFRDRLLGRVGRHRRLPVQHGRADRHRARRQRRRLRLVRNVPQRVADD